MIKINLYEENDYVRNALVYGEDYLTTYCQEHKITKKLALERLRHQIKNKILLEDITSVSVLDSIMEQLNWDYFPLERIVKTGSKGLYSTLIKIVLPKEKLSGLYIKYNLSKEEIEELYIDKYPFVNKSSLKKLLSSYRITKPRGKIDENLRAKYYSNKEKIDEAKVKREKTMISRYGVKVPTQNKDVIDKMKATNLTKYGVENVAQVKEFREKQERSFVQNYYTKNLEKNFEKLFTPTPYVKNKSDLYNLLKGNKKGKIGKELRELLSVISKEKNIDRFTLEQVSDILGVNYSYLNTGENKVSAIIVSKNSDILKSNHLGGEDSLFNYINSLTSKEIIRNKHYDFLEGKQIDIYIPELRLGFEYNGVYYHASSGSQGGVSYKYHMEKSHQARKAGITIFHVFENEWLDDTKKEILKSQIAYKLHSDSIDRVYARKTKAMAISSKVAEKFLNENHIQGGKQATGTYRYGLYHNDELVSVMTFGRHRFSNNGDMELIRFSNKKYTSVIGGASKLLKEFENNFNNINIISYANNNFAFGDDKSMYTEIGFSYIKSSSRPSYQWVKKVKGTFITISKRTVRNKRLLDYTNNKATIPFPGATKDFRVIDQNETETKYMTRNGCFKIDNAGTDLYIKRVED